MSNAKRASKIPFLMFIIVRSHPFSKSRSLAAPKPYLPSSPSKKASNVCAILFLSGKAPSLSCACRSFEKCTPWLAHTMLEKERSWLTPFFRIAYKPARLAAMATVPAIVYAMIKLVE